MLDKSNKAFDYKQKYNLEPNAVKYIQMMAIDVNRLKQSCIITSKSLAPLEVYRLSFIGKIDVGNKTIFKNAEVVKYFKHNDFFY